jgi:glutaredoxin
MNFVVYSKTGCPYCDKVKMVLEHLKQKQKCNYVVYELNKEFTRENFYSQFGNSSTFPQVICDEKYIGGCNETVKYLQENSIL